MAKGELSVGLLYIVNKLVKEQAAMDMATAPALRVYHSTPVSEGVLYAANKFLHNPASFYAHIKGGVAAKPYPAVLYKLLH